MTRQKLERTVRKEIAALNELIDWKIIKGMPYSREARRHRFLLRQLSRAEETHQVSWFGTTLSAVFH